MPTSCGRYAFLFLAVSILSVPALAKSRGENLFKLCTSCHGPNGQGNQSVGAPAIAGLPEWYIVKQLETFAAGGRGRHPEDDAGNRMRSMAMTMDAEDQKLVAAYVAGMKPATPEVTIHGNAEKGKAYFAVCVACHGPNADGNQALHAPPLKFSGDWYLFKQLGNFKKKLRGNDASKDAFGATMAPITATLPDEQAMKDVVTYIQSLK